MESSTRLFQIVLILGFLIIIVGVPAGQIAVELYRGEPVQCTDLFRHPPTRDNLRRFEQSLEDTWWGRETVLPQMQNLLFTTFHSTGTQAVAGRDNWIFYQPGVRYLVQADRRELDESNTTWVVPPTGETRRDSAVKAIVRFRDQLQNRGIRLLVVPVPGKASVYPDKLSRHAKDRWRGFRSPTEDLLDELDAYGVETVNLFAAFRTARQEDSPQDGGKEFYLPHDTHWTPVGAKLAAGTVAKKIRQLSWTPEYPYKYSKNTVRVKRCGDILQMMQVPGALASFEARIVRCEQVLDPFLGALIVPDGTGYHGTYMNGHLIDTPMEASFLLLGDSYSRIYQITEPASQGEVVDVAQQSDPANDDGSSPQHVAGNTSSNGPPANEERHDNMTKKRLLPGSAGFPSLLAYDLEAPVDFIISDGGAATDVRQRLSANSEILDNKNVIIWEFAERDIRLGKSGWQNIPLPE